MEASMPKFAEKATKVYLENSSRAIKVEADPEAVAAAVFAAKGKMVSFAVLSSSYTVTGDTIWLDASRVTGLRSCCLPTLEEQEAMLANIIPEQE